MTELEQMPRGEHPRPQFYREDWVNLNGTWTFALDAGKSGLSRKLQESRGLERRITVPFCPESVLSGVTHVDFIECMWYQRMISVPAEWSGRRVLDEARHQIHLFGSQLATGPEVRHATG